MQIALAHTDVDVISSTITDIPSDITSVNLDLDPNTDGMSPIYYSESTFQDMPASAYQAQLAVPDGVFPSYVVDENVEVRYGGTSASDIDRVRTYASLPSATTFSAASIALVSVNTLDVSDPVHPQATWSVGAGTRGDYGTVVMQWSGGTSTGSYSAWFPTSHATSWRMPDVPPDLSSFAPTATSTFVETRVTYTDDERIVGYQQSSLFHNIPPVDGLGVIVSSGATYPSP